MKKTVLVTGANGFIGKNLIATLNQIDDLKIIAIHRDNVADLDAGLAEADFVFHLAGANRPENVEDFKKINTDLTAVITKRLLVLDKKTPLLITSSIQAGLDNPYGKSKRAAEELVEEYAKAAKAPIYIYRLQNVFGKWSRPNYNSVVATFCYNISHGRPITINDPDSKIELVYIDSVVASFIACLENKKPTQADYPQIKESFKTTVGELATTITDLHQIRSTLIVPDLSSDFNKYLYATLLSQLDESEYAYPHTAHNDDRGWLFEFIKSKSFGQIFISKTRPGFTRGQHWHHTKIEKFAVIQGSGELFFREYGSDKVFSYKLSDKEFLTVDVPVGYVHAISNTSNKDMIMVIWASEILDKEHPDTYYEEVQS